MHLFQGATENPGEKLQYGHTWPYLRYDDHLPFLFPEKERLKLTQRKREIRLGYRRENINAVLAIGQYCVMMMKLSEVSWATFLKVVMELSEVSIGFILAFRRIRIRNSTCSRLVRKSLCFSKCKEILDNHLDVYQCYNNLIRINSALTIKTPRGLGMSRGHPVWQKELLVFKVGH